MHDALAVLIVTEWFDRQWEQEWLFFGEHRRDLAFGRAMDARVGPAQFPVVQVSLRLVQAFEAHAFERRFLRVSDTGLDFPFAIRILNPARHRHNAIVRQHVLKQRIERRIVNVGL